MELQRFIARQRKPDKIISGNAGQLKLAKSKLESMGKSDKGSKSAIPCCRTRNHLIVYY